MKNLDHFLLVMSANTESLKSILFSIKSWWKNIYVYIHIKNCLLKENYKNSFPWPKPPSFLYQCKAEYGVGSEEQAWKCDQVQHKVTQASQEQQSCPHLL